MVSNSHRPFLPSSGRRPTVVAAGAARRAAEVSSDTPAWSAVAITVALMAASWGLGWAAGGAGRVVPHWYYFPVLFAALRFGPRGALAVALASGVLAGPLTPQLAAEELAQHPWEWLTRAGFFVAVGQAAAVLARPALPSLVAELQRHRAERAVRRAMARDELTLWFQPIVSVGDGRIVGAEALLRWRHPERGVLSPGAFLPLVEQTSAIHDIGAWVLRRACAEAARWHDPAVWVAVNVSGAELDAAALPERVADAAEAAGLLASRLCVEVTESVLVADLAGSAERLTALERMGVRIAIDDFGTGYSSLAYLHRFPAHVLKIDRTFVAGLDSDPQRAAIVGGVILMARTLGMATTAEGVETRRQADQLCELGCDHSQGFFHHYPMPADEFAELLRARQPNAETSQPWPAG